MTSPVHPSPSRFARLLTCKSRPEAEMLASLLEERGIPTLLRSPAQSGLFSAAPTDPLLAVEIHVPEDALPEARDVLTAFDPPAEDGP